MAIFEIHSDTLKINSSLYNKKIDNESKNQINITKKNNCYNMKTHSTKKTNLFKAYQFDNLINSADIETHRKNYNKLTQNIQQDLLFGKLSVFFDKKKLGKIFGLPLTILNKSLFISELLNIESNSFF